MYFILYACCIPVKGFRRSLICDVQRNSFSLIPNGLYLILTEQLGSSVEQIKERYPEDEQETVAEYFEFLVSKEYGFYNESPILNLPPLNLDFRTPETITNALIDVCATSGHDYRHFSNQLSRLRCKALQLRFFDPISLAGLSECLGYFEKSTLRSIQVCLPYTDEFSSENISLLVAERLRLQTIIFHSCPQDSFRPLFDNLDGTKLYYLNYGIDNEQCCGEVSSLHFSFNLKAFCESHHVNSCLHKKISIDAQGKIKNCPSMKTNFGSSSHDTWEEIIGLPEFQQLWNITKDDISICRDCEFKYVCTDCRAYLINPQDQHSKPLKCGYNPYTSEWKDWTSMPENLSAAKFYQLL